MTYTVTLRHDAGTYALTLTARDAEHAARLACDIEHAPPRSVIDVTEGT
jgi:hypothetical protein